jgi:transcription factor SFP1
LLSKPFKCPKPNCNKSYKQANGLKYHVTHGSCSLKPVREVEAVRVLLASKSSSRNNSQPGSPTLSTPNSPNDPSAMTQAEGDYGLTQEELLAIEKRVRPYACGIGECSRRYKNMNGLRYHYSHTGDHGKRGLEMLAKGVHECLQRNAGSGTGSGSSRPETPEFTQNANVRELPLQPIEPQLDPAFQAQPVFAQPAHVQVQGQTSFQPYPFQQQSYTLAGAMGPGVVYGGGSQS